MTSKITQAFLLALIVLLNYSASAFNVTFRVDMSQQTGFSSVNVNGTFNNWCGSCFVLTDADGDQIWEGTAPLAAGNYEYKFTANGWGMQESLIPGSTCTLTTGNFTNRTLAVTGDVVLPVVCWGACTDCASAPAFYDVTFQVDMNGQTGFTIPEVNGSFNGWCGNCNPLTDTNGDGIWTTTITLLEGDYEYKFSHDAWAGQEHLTAGSLCTMTTDTFTNRVLSLTQDIVLPPVCYGSCSACGVVTPVHTVDFQVDMQAVTGVTSVEVNGNFNGWCGACFMLGDADGDGIWTGQTSLDAGAYEYKFTYNGGSVYETLQSGSPCTITTGTFTNRSLSLSSDTLLGVVCWESCAACNVLPTTYNVDFQVDMQGVTGVTSVEVNGTFNGWCGSCFALSDGDGDGIWTGHAALEAGAYEYKFTYNGGTYYETLEVGSACTITSNGFTNRVLNVSGDTALDVVCWQSCAACGVLPALLQMTLPVTFEDAQVEYGLIGFGGAEDSQIIVDPAMAGNHVARVVKSAAAETWAGTTITAAAELGFAQAIPFTATETYMNVRVWTPAAGTQVRLKVEDHNDPTHSVETDAFTTVAGDWEVLTFDFSNEGAGTAALNLAYTFDKASIFFNYGTTGAVAGEQTYYFDDVNFGPGGALPTNYAVTFRVDMQNVSGFSNPEVNGTFNGWCGSCFQLSDADGDQIWEGTASIAAGNYEFKFAADNWGMQENLIPGTPCTITTGNFTNRTLEITGDTLLPVVCWGSCSDCASAPVTYDVTFQVDMNGVLGFTTPEVNGTFNGWCGNCFQMSDANGDNIWEATTTIEEGDYEFKFSADNWTISEQLTSGDPCTVTNGQFVNRSLHLHSDTIMAPVCWALCGPCSEPQPVNVTFNVDLGTLAATSVEIAGTFNGFCVACAPMINTSGTQYSVTLPINPGVYYYFYTINGGETAEVLTADVCTVESKGGVMREIIVSEDVNVATVCWESCAACPASVNEKFAGEMQLYPNPANTAVRLVLQNAMHARYEVVDATGRVVISGNTMGRNQLDLSTLQLSEGLYQVRVSEGTRVLSSNLLIQH